MKPKFWMDIGNSIAFNFDVATCLYHAHITLFIQVLLPIKKSKKKKKVKKQKIQTKEKPYKRGELE